MSDPSSCFIKYELKFSQNFLERLDSEYQKVLLKLFNELCENKKNILKSIELIENFSKKYLMLPQLWKYRREFKKEDASISHRGMSDLITRECSDFFTLEKSFKHKSFTKASNKTINFIWDKDYFNFILNKNAECPILFNLESAKNLLTFPHAYLQEIYENYQNYSDQVLPQNIYLKYKKALKDYKRIKHSETIEEKFFAILETRDDERVIIQNIELMIARNPCNKWLWKAYLEFLKNWQPRAYLETLKKYTRFFISDIEMREKYEEESLELCDTMEYENAPKLETFRFENTKMTKVGKINANLHRAFDEFTRQNFILPNPIIIYILNSANPRILQILFESCKHLFLLKPTPICHNFKHGHGFSIKGQTLTISHRKQIPKEMKKLFITNIISISTNKSSTILSLLIPNIAESHARFINLKGQNLSWNEFRFLTNPQKVKVFYFKDGRITNALGEVANFSEVIGRIPIAKKISVTGLKSTETTSAELAALKRRIKLELFNIGEVTQDFDYYDFQKFVKDNAIQNSPKFTINFKFGTPRSPVNNFIMLIKNEHLKNKFYKPSFRVMISKKK